MQNGGTPNHTLHLSEGSTSTDGHDTKDCQQASASYCLVTPLLTTLYVAWSSLFHSSAPHRAHPRPKDQLRDVAHCKVHRLSSEPVP